MIEGQQKVYRQQRKVLQPNSGTHVGDVANVARAEASVAAKKQQPALAAESSLAGSAVEDLVAVGHSPSKRFQTNPRSQRYVRLIISQRNTLVKLNAGPSG
jgi:hypothetical protein